MTKKKKEKEEEKGLFLGNKRKNAVERYKAAYNEFKESGEDDFVKFLTKNGSSYQYPLMKLDEFPPGVDVDRVVSDLIGFVTRMINRKYNEPFIEAVANFTARFPIRALNMKCETLSDEELVKELTRRGIKCNRYGQFYREEIVRVPINIEEPSES